MFTLVQRSSMLFFLSYLTLLGCSLQLTLQLSLSPIFPFPLYFKSFLYKHHMSFIYP